jgi:hypothetical protein
LGGSLVWTYTYTIEHTTPPVVPANGSSTVACLANAVPPLSVAPCPSPYPVTQWPDYDCMFKTYMNSVLDQQQTSFASYVLDVNTGVGQSFTPAVSGLLTAIDVNIYQKTGTPNFILEIYAGGTKTGTPIYSSAGYTITGTGWISIPITGTQPTLVAGTQYTFWFTSYPYNSVRLSIGNNVYSGGVCMDECAAYVVKDVCGNAIPTPEPVITDNYDGCEGTREYANIPTPIVPVIHLYGNTPTPSNATPLQYRQIQRLPLLVCPTWLFQHHLQLTTIVVMRLLRFQGLLQMHLTAKEQWFTPGLIPIAKETAKSGHTQLPSTITLHQQS